MTRLRKIYRFIILGAFLISVLSSFLLPSQLGAEQKMGSDSLKRLLPPESQLKRWKLDGAPQTAVGQELYHLINGGAEIYMQEGFKQAILASYRKSEEKIIILEHAPNTESFDSFCVIRVDKMCIFHLLFLYICIQIVLNFFFREDIRGPVLNHHVGFV